MELFARQSDVHVYAAIVFMYKFLQNEDQQQKFNNEFV